MSHARTLHDDLQQELYALQIMLHEARNEDEREPSVRTLDEASRSVRVAISIGRTLTSELSPPLLDDEGLAEALAWLANHMLERYDLRVELETNDGASLDTELRVLIVQVVRELLFNVVKHASTDRATVRLHQEATQVTIVVEDRGAGFDPALLEQRSNGMGLTTIRRRLKLLGGRLHLETGAEQGTTVVVTLPLENQLHHEMAAAQPDPGT